MDKIITTVLLIIAGVICTIVVFNSVYPMVNRSSDSMNAMTQTLNERMKSRISIVHATYDDSGAPTDYEVSIWVKNVGDMRITQIEESDLFFGEEGNWGRIPHEDDASGYPEWSYDITNDTEWGIGATIEITIDYDSTSLDAGTYYIKFAIPNGIDAEYYFSI